MSRFFIYLMIYLGAALMAFNIFGFARFAGSIRKQHSWEEGNGILYFPIALLTMFLLGYLAVGLFGKPDLIMAGILFGGSIFVFIMYRLLSGITHRIAENEQLEAKLMAAEEANAAKTSFLAGISHEMRTPMNVILGLDGMALKDPDLKQETRGYLEKIRLSARMLLGLINNILDMNRIETGSLTIQNAEFSLEDTLAQVNAVTGTLCETKGLRYEYRMPEGGGGRYIGDEVQLKHVLMSILDNAVKYTNAPGTVRLSVERVAADATTQTMLFTVEDSGVGIDSSFLPRLFEPFSQEDASSTNQFGGSGLSLAVTKNIVELMGGSIAVRSEKNVGSTFTVTLPLRCVPQDGEPEAPAAPEEAAQTPVSLEGRRVLVAEDLPENAEIVMDLLELEGIEPEHAENGRIALEMFSGHPENYYDAILMDLRMPEMDGLTATRSIRALDRPDAKTVPIIALTANAFESDVKQSLGAGMNVHLAKPTDADLLYTVLRQEIGRAARSERSTETW